MWDYVHFPGKFEKLMQGLTGFSTLEVYGPLYLLNLYLMLSCNFYSIMLL